MLEIRDFNMREFLSLADQFEAIRATAKKRAMSMIARDMARLGTIVLSVDGFVFSHGDEGPSLEALGHTPSGSANTNEIVRLTTNILETAQYLEDTFGVRADAIKISSRSPWLYEESGLEDIYLLNGYAEREEYEDGEAVQTTIILAVEELHAAIGDHIVTSGMDITGPMARFLRVELGMTVTYFERYPGIREMMIVKAEASNRRVFHSDILRLLYAEHRALQGKHLDISLKPAASSEPDDRRMLFMRTVDGWQPA